MRRKKLGALLGGAVLIFAGTAGFTWAQLVEVDPSIERAAGVGMICGTVILCARSLARLIEQGQAGNEETYNFGFDMGFESGYQERRRQESPVVVDFALRKAGRPKASRSARKVADRG